MNKTSYKTDGKMVFMAQIARQLIRMGYQVIDIKPNKSNTDSTIFVFKNEGNFINDFEQLKNKLQY